MTLEGRAAALEALAAGRGAVVWQRMIADVETPVSAALKLIEPGRGDWVLESVESGETRGRYSLIGLDPDLLFEVTGDTARINRNWRHDREAFRPVEAGALQALRDLVAECRFDVPEALPKALATLVGFFAYETIGLVERIPRAAGAGLNLPDMVFVRPTTILVFDRLADELFLIAPIWPDPDAPIDRMIDGAQDRIDTIAARLSSANAHGAKAETALLPDMVAAQPATTPERFAEMVAAAKEYIAAGDIFQVVLSQRFSTPFDLPPFDLYRALRRINPSPFLYFLDLPGFALIGSSPEILVRVRDGEITIRPIAGTRPRGRTSAEDAENRESLLADPKERAEHLMLLDLGRNDVGRAAVGGSVTVTDSYTVEFYSHVMHIVSNVIGRIAPDKDAIDPTEPWVLPSFDYAYIPSMPVAGGELDINLNARTVYRDRQDPYFVSPDDRMAGVEGLNSRMTAEARWRRSFITPGGLVITPLLSLRGDAFYLNQDAQASADAYFMANSIGAVARAEAYRYMATAGLELRWPILFSTTSATHIIEPVAQIFLRNNEQYAGQLPNEDAQSFVFDASTLFAEDKFAGYDRMEGGDRANVGVRYSGTFANGWTADALFGQSYQLGGLNSFAEPDFVNATAGSGLETSVSDFVGMAGVSDQELTLALRGRFDHETFAVRRAEVAAQMNFATASGALQYAFISARPEYGYAEDRHQVTLSSKFNVNADWRLFGSGTY
ncbi:MAG: LPS assembly protein LptD, partial [Sphingopyxis terrae]|nr:LPS assembly protein LptD [Sphingopyxis terrae]